MKMCFVVCQSSVCVYISRIAPHLKAQLHLLWPCLHFAFSLFFLFCPVGVTQYL